MKEPETTEKMPKEPIDKHNSARVDKVAIESSPGMQEKKSNASVNSPEASPKSKLQARQNQEKNEFMMEVGASHGSGS